jgi:cytochrome c556
MRIKTMLAALGVMALAGTAMAQGDVIVERRAGLKRMGGHMEAIKPVVEAKGDVGKFQEANTALLGQLAVLKTAAAAGDTAGFAAAYADTGPKFCGSCHRPFRAR